MDFDRYKRLEFIIQNWSIGIGEKSLLDYLCYLGLVEDKGSGYKAVINNNYLFTCSDGEKRIVFVEHDEEYFLLLEFWLKLINVNRQRGINVVNKIKFNEFK